VSTGDDTRQRIEQAALELFLVRGYVGTPVRVIAEEAQVTTPALYWHYKSKDELCASILTRVYREFDELLRVAVKDGSPEEQLRAYVEASVSLNLHRRSRSARVGFDQLVASLPPASRAELAELQRPLLNLLLDILREGDALGVFHVLDPTITALAIISMANYAFTWYRTAASATVAEIAASYAEFAMRLARGQVKEAGAQGAELPAGAVFPHLG
jgi:AcrR family transcriptional regulator